MPRSLSILIGVTSTAILLQAVTAGVFVDQEGRDSWVTVHGLIADATWICALATAVVAFRRVRRTRPDVWFGAAALFVLALAQTGLGHLITDGGMDWLIVLHIPVAMIIFGLSIWLAVAAARSSREVAVDTYGGTRTAPDNVSRSLTRASHTDR